MKKILLWIWQLPQNILGFIVSRFSKKEIINGVTVYYKHLMHSGVSLGNYIIMDDRDDINYYYYPDVAHEHGHQLQSLYLGPLYLIVIGLPSVIGNLVSRIFHKDSKWYYNQPWEKWADKLGKVVR